MSVLYWQFCKVFQHYFISTEAWTGLTPSLISLIRVVVVFLFETHIHSTVPQPNIMKQQLHLITTALFLLLPAASFTLSPPLTTQHKHTTLSPLYSAAGGGEDITIEQYSRCLSPSEEKQIIKRERRQYSIVDDRPRWQRILGEMIFFSCFCLSSLW